MNDYVMNRPMLVSDILMHAARHHGDTEVVSYSDGTVLRSDYRRVEARARQLATALTRLGIRIGDSVGTLAWNSQQHLELYYGIAGLGAVCHTVNPRLFDEQIAYIINDAGDRLVFFDGEFLPIVKRVAPSCPSVEAWVALGDVDIMPDASLSNLMDYEPLLSAESSSFSWPALDENMPALLCYTSGTTGAPKGVIYTHRSTVLHAYICALPDSQNLSAREVVMPVVPMFHVKAWETPFSAPLVGAKLVFPGGRLDGGSLFTALEEQEVTLAMGVPTVWLNLLRHVETNGLRFSTLRRLLVGGAVVPTSMVDAFSDLGVELSQGWGMTETAALTTCTRPLLKHNSLSPKDLRARVYENQGRILPGADMRLIDANGEEAPWDGRTRGQLEVRAPWVTARYFKAQGSALVDGWFPTGDIATIDPDGFMNVVDRDKDVVKSGGEWISSVEIENIAAAHPDVLIAACIAQIHPKWGERPLLIVVKRQDAKLTKSDLLHFYEGKVVKWWIPDDVIFLDEMPLTSTGKLFKMKLREAFKDYVFSA
jgi:fatty-acyl-CoA synthase